MGRMTGELHVHIHTAAESLVHVHMHVHGHVHTAAESLVHVHMHVHGHVHTAAESLLLALETLVECLFSRHLREEGGE